MSNGTAFAALADPTRRKLFERVRRREHRVGDLAKALKISQPAVSQHLKVLRNARLVRERREGTSHWFRASPEGLAELRAWVEASWDDVLAAFADESGDAPKEK